MKSDSLRRRCLAARCWAGSSAVVSRPPAGRLTKLSLRDGAAECVAVEKAQTFIRHVTRQSGGQTPPGAGKYSQALSSLRALRALIGTTVDRYDAAGDDPDVLDSIAFGNAIAMLKVDASELAVATVMSAMRACGLSGYREDGDFSIGRALRDILSAPIMIHNDRIIASAAAASLMAPVPRGLRT